MRANHGLRNARPRQKIARILQERSGLSISTKLLIGNPAAPLRESTMAAPVWVAPGSRLFLVAYESADGKPYAFALSDLDVAHKLARACGGEVIDTAVDRMGDSDFLNQL